jgi:hypothetical protein
MWLSYVLPLIYIAIIQEYNKVKFGEHGTHLRKSLCNIMQPFLTIDAGVMSFSLQLCAVRTYIGRSSVEHHFPPVMARIPPWWCVIVISIIDRFQSINYRIYEIGHITGISEYVQHGQWPVGEIFKHRWPADVQILTPGPSRCAVRIHISSV